MKRALHRHSGSEGPRHDPYGYEERTMTIDGVDHTLHAGLMVWYEVNGKRQKFSVPANRAPYGTEYETACVAAWEHATGVSVEQFDRYYWRAHPYFPDPMGHPSMYE